MRKLWGISPDIPGYFEELTGEDCIDQIKNSRVYCSSGWTKGMNLPYRKTGPWTETLDWSQDLKMKDGDILPWLCNQAKGNWYLVFEPSSPKYNLTDGLNNVRVVIDFEYRTDALWASLCFDFHVYEGNPW